MEKARAALLEAIEGISAEVPALPGHQELLLVKAKADHDWQQTAERMAARSWWFDRVRADDMAGNVRQQLHAHQLAAAGDLEDRQRAWAVLGSLESYLLAERRVLCALEDLVALRSTLWDPRLDEVAEITVAMRQFWTELAPTLPRDMVLPLAGPAVEPRLPEALGEAVRQLLQLELSPGQAEQRHAARPVVGGTRFLVWSLAWNRIETVCTEVGQHAARSAARVKDAERRRTYVDLQRQCETLVAALQGMRGA
jgi:hypothetical protein